ncbi:MAG: class I SAM-dependent methyltransferase [Ramlibacter sp.]
MEQQKIWEHFQNPGEGHDAFFNSAPRYQFLAGRLAANLHVLNIGVGRGGLEDLLMAKGVVVSCLDPSETAIEFIREKHGLGGRAKVGFSQSMSFADGQFDAVVMSEVLEHLDTETLDATLKEVKRVLKRGGRLIGTVPADEILANNLALCPHCGESFHRWGHVQSFSIERLRGIFQSHGFTATRMQTRVFPDWGRPGAGNFIKSVARYFLGRAGSPIASPTIYFEASAA